MGGSGRVERVCLYVAGLAIVGVVHIRGVSQCDPRLDDCREEKIARMVHSSCGYWGVLCCVVLP